MHTLAAQLCIGDQLYFKEIQPTLELFPSQLYHWLLEIVTENERDLGLIHPVLPDQVGADPFIYAHTLVTISPYSKGTEFLERTEWAAALRKPAGSRR